VYGDTKRMSEPYKRMFDPILSKKDFKQIRTAFLSVNYFNDFIEENKLVLSNNEKYELLEYLIDTFKEIEKQNIKEFSIKNNLYLYIKQKLYFKSKIIRNLILKGII